MSQVAILQLGKECVEVGDTITPSVLERRLPLLDLSVHNVAQVNNDLETGRLSNYHLKRDQSIAARR